MVDRPRLRYRDYATAASVAALLVVAYVLYPHPILQYAVWLVIFTVWMVWFVSFGVDWLFPESADETRE